MPYTADAFNPAVPVAGNGAGYMYLELQALKTVLVEWRKKVNAVACFDDTGTADVITIVIPNHVTGNIPQVLYVRVNVANTGTVHPTISISGDVAVTVKAQGALMLPQDNLLGDRVHIFVYDPVAACYIVMNANTSLPVNVPVRQTVLSGPVGSIGEADFGGLTGTTTVTATGTLIATAANGFTLASGAVNRVGQITNPSWTGLSTNGTMYLYLDIAANGTCTTGSGTLVPTYQEGNSYSTSNNQFTFSIAEMVGKVGNGLAAVQTYRVYVGEVTVAGAVVTAITWYAVQGKFVSAVGAMVAAQTTAHKLGLIPKEVRAISVCTTAVAPFAIGDETNITVSIYFGGGWGYAGSTVYKTRASIVFNLGNSFTVIPVTTGTLNIVSANFGLRLEADRGW